MTDYAEYANKLAPAAGFDAPRLLRYDDVTAHAIARDDHFQGELAGIRLAGVGKIEDFQRAACGANTEPNHDFSFCRDCVSSRFGFQAPRFAGRADFGSLSTTSR
jgi:hypothetical protein